MPLKNAQYYAIMRQYEQTQLKNHNIQAERYEEVYRKLPEFKTLDESISVLSVQYGKKLLNGDDHALSSLKEELGILRKSKQALLASGGFPEDYLDPVYDCPDCRDTGYIGDQKCHCFRQAVIRLLYEESNIKEFPTEASFDNFSLDFYSDAQYDKTTGRSARAMMEDTLRVCHQFIDHFGEKFQNLLFYGSVGVGKTFLSTCIAREIMDREFSVLYFSAPQLFSALTQNKFDRNDIDAKNMSDYIFHCDLLIIDDLGSEYTNAFIASQFFTCINERLIHRKSTIISTNLSLESIADLYTERSFSRITSSYILLKMIGDDIRIKKKLNHREEH
ncbi:ATP-binding protein [Clostridium sp. Marseille-P3244]|uniref:ATP-binding protein n=1 Tax=Clostridium sp. Marseille-P3244 TaxID=1871020 RepID=UPI00092FF2D7|nr:ATP-binding protein [Clostridium sp. Marseille-P3244]